MTNVTFARGSIQIRPSFPFVQFLVREFKQLILGEKWVVFYGSARPQRARTTADHQGVIYSEKPSRHLDYNIAFHKCVLDHLTGLGSPLTILPFFMKSDPPVTRIRTWFHKAHSLSCRSVHLPEPTICSPVPSARFRNYRDVLTTRANPRETFDLWTAIRRDHWSSRNLRPRCRDPTPTDSNYHFYECDRVAV